MKYIAAAVAALLLAGNASFAAEAANDDPWTEDQIQTLCFYRAEKYKSDPNLFDTCMKKNEDKIGRPKQPGDAQMLNKADNFLAKMAKDRAKSQPETPAATP